jgi:hypothetical protein
MIHGTGASERRSFFRLFASLGPVNAQSADAAYGKWSDSANQNTCKMPIGSSPDEATLYQITAKGISFYEIDCAARDLSFHIEGNE